MKGEPKEQGTRIYGNTGWPKGSNSHGHGGLVVRYSWYNLYGRGSSLFVISKRNYHSHARPKVILDLEKLNEYSKKSEKNIIRQDKRIYSKFLLNQDLFVIAYNKSNPGNMTKGSDELTLDGISLKVINKIIDELRNETFQFKPGRRIQIPKASGGERPLTIGSPRDKLVQEVMRMILEAIFEPTFSNNSHGFRPNRSCHSALRQVFTRFRPCY